MATVFGKLTVQLIASTTSSYANPHINRTLTATTFSFSQADYELFTATTGGVTRVFSRFAASGVLFMIVKNTDATNRVLVSGQNAGGGSIGMNVHAGETAIITDVSTSATWTFTANTADCDLEIWLVGD